MSDHKCPNCSGVQIYQDGKVHAQFDCPLCGFPLDIKINKLQEMFMVEIAEDGEKIAIAEDCVEKIE